MSFLSVKAAEYDNPPNRGNQTTAPKYPKTHSRTILTANRAISTIHLQNHINADNNGRAGDNLRVETDSHANQLNYTVFACNNIQAKSSFLRTNKENKR